MQQQTQYRAPSFTPVRADTPTDSENTDTSSDTDTAFSTLRDLYTELVARFEALTVQNTPFAGRAIPNSQETNTGSLPTPTPITDITSFPHRSHSSLTNLTNSDDHTQYLYKSGRAGGQTLVGGIYANDILTLQSSTATTGTTSTEKALKIIVGSGGETEALTILNNGNIGFQKTNPGFTLDVGGIVNATAIYANGTPMVSSQWTTTGTNIFYTTGNVGIGTSTPTTSLDIAGSLKATGLIFPTGAVAGYVLTTDANGVASWTDVSSSAGPWSLTGNNLYPDSTSNNLAIGATDAGSAKLYVNGNVGIGTTSPGAKLDVVGELKISTTNDRISSQGRALDISIDTTSSGNQWAYNEVNLRNYDETNQGAASRFIVGGYSGALDMVKYNSVTTDTGGAIRANAGLIRDSGAAGLGLVAGGGSGQMRFYTGGTAAANERIRILSTGNVGIGTTSPEASLQISKTLSNAPYKALILQNNDSGVRLASTIYMDFANDNTAVPRARILSGGETDWSGYDGYLSFLTDDDGTLGERVRITSTGNVGIGTTAPTNILSLGGNSARTFWLERHTTANTAGNTLTVTAGGATSGATDKAGGDLILTPGLSTGTGESGVQIKGVPAGSTGTTDGTQTLMIQVLGNKFGVFANTPVVKQTGIAALKVDYTAGDLDTEAEIITAINTTNTAINALRTALNNYGFTTVV